MKLLKFSFHFTWKIIILIVRLFNFYRTEDVFKRWNGLIVHLSIIGLLAFSVNLKNGLQFYDKWKRWLATGHERVPTRTNHLFAFSAFLNIIFINTNKSYADETNEEHPSFGIRNAKVNEYKYWASWSAPAPIKRKREINKNKREKTSKWCLFFQFFLFIYVFILFRERINWWKKVGGFHRRIFIEKEFFPFEKFPPHFINRPFDSKFNIILRNAAAKKNIFNYYYRSNWKW